MRLLDAVRVEARTLLADRLGLDFSRLRQDEFERRLVQAARASGVSGPDHYLRLLQTLPDESPDLMRLAGYLTVGETYFFRDWAYFEALEREVLPPLIAARRAEGILRLRVWSAACATGEEPYSLAILLDRLLPDRANWSLTILATDINARALTTAERGIYRKWSLRATPQSIRGLYFIRREGDTFELDSRIRDMVTFAPINLASDVYPALATNTTAMDLILCRNTLMYFSREAQLATVERLQRALVSGGWIGVGPAEASAELFRALAPVSFTGAVLYRNAPSPSASASSPAGMAPTDVLDGPPLDPSWGASEAAEPAARPSTGEQEDAPVDAATLLRQARTHADLGNLERADELCRAALALDRLDPQAHLLLAAVCQERGEVAAALEALRAAIYLAPDSVLAHFLLGSLLFRQRKTGLGRRSLETVVNLLGSSSRDEPVAGADGLTAGELLDTARAYLELPA